MIYIIVFIYAYMHIFVIVTNFAHISEMQRAARVDSNQKELVKQIRGLNYSVLIVSQLKNCFDILVGAKGKNYAFEIKDPEKPPSKRRLTEGEQRFFDNWKGQVNIALTIDDVLNVINND